MSQFNQLHVPTLSADQFILRGQRFNLDGANINGVQTSTLTTEVIINDDTKNQALFAEIYGNIHGNTFPQLQAEIVALQGNVALLQAEDIVLQNQINVINGNITTINNQISNINSNVSGIQANTQYLHAPYAGLGGNTSYFTNGLQVWNGVSEAGNGIFSYVDGASPSNQIRLSVQNAKGIFLDGGSTTIAPTSGGNVNINGSGGSAPFNFNVFNPGLLNSTIRMKGDIELAGNGNSSISIFTQPASLIPPSPAIDYVNIRGGNEAQVLGPTINVQADNNLTLQAGNGGTIDINTPSTGSSNSTITIGTNQGLANTGYQVITIGSGGASQARNSSTFLEGDNYLPYVAATNTGLWDGIAYVGLPTTYSGPLHGPLKTTYTPYVKSISCFFAGSTINSFISTAGSFTVGVGVGSINLTCGVGGFLLSTGAGLLALQTGVGGITLTTAAGAISITTAGGALTQSLGAGAFTSTTGAGIQRIETGSADIQIASGYAPGGTSGDVVITSKNNISISPDVGLYLEKVSHMATINNGSTPPGLPAYSLYTVNSNLYYNGTIIGGSGGGVTQLLAGNGITVNPTQGTGIVTVSATGSYVPPGGYLPVIGGNMVGDIYMKTTSSSQASHIYQGPGAGQVKLYRPLSSYQAPFPSIGPPTYTGELLTFYNGDNNSPTQSNFTGWFPQSLVSAQPDHMTQLITGPASTIYSQANTNTPSAFDPNYCFSAVTLTNGVHITDGTIYISQIDTTQSLQFSIALEDTSTIIYTKSFPAGSFPSSGLFTFTLDYTLQDATGQYIAQWYNNNSKFSLMVVNPAQKQNWCGTLTSGTVSFYLMAVKSGTATSIFQWYPGTNTTTKVFVLDGSVYGIQEQMISTRYLYFYGLFDTFIVGESSSRVNNIFAYNVDSGGIITLQSETALLQNPPIGTNGAVYGVEVDTTNDRTWLWGDFTYVGTNAQGQEPGPLGDVALNCGCDFTTTANWSSPVMWQGVGGYGNCRGGKLLAYSTANYSLMVWAGTIGDGGNPQSFLPFNAVGMNYYNPSYSQWTVALASCFNSGSISQEVANIQVIDSYLFLTGSFNNGSSSGGTTCLSIMYTPANQDVIDSSGAYDANLNEAYNSSNTGFWIDNGVQISVSNLRKMTGDLLVINTNGYGLTNGGGVLTIPISQTTTLPTQWPITGMPRYSTNFIGGNDKTNILLTCSLNQNNFFYSQTFDSSPIPTPTDPTVVAINGAKFLVDNTPMDKIVFAGSDQDYSSVSFIAGKVEDNDYNWYWQAQVGQLNYFSGNTLYANVSACPPQPGLTTSTWGQVLVNGNIASKSIDMSSFDIKNANTIYSANILTLSAPGSILLNAGNVKPTLVLDNATNSNIGVHFGNTNDSMKYSSSLSYNPSTQTLSCPNFIGNITGTLITASSIATTGTTANVSYNIPFVTANATTASQTLYTDAFAHLTFNPSSNQLNASGTMTNNGMIMFGSASQILINNNSVVTPAISGANVRLVSLPLANITAATFTGNVTRINTTSDNTSGTYYIPFSKTTATPSTQLFLDDTTSALSYNPSTSTLTATTFSGALSGTSTNTTNVAITDTTSTSGTYYPTFVSSNIGNLPVRVDSQYLTYNPSTNVLQNPNFLVSNGTETVNTGGLLISTGGFGSKTIRTENNTGTTNNALFIQTVNTGNSNSSIYDTRRAGSGTGGTGITAFPSWNLESSFFTPLPLGTPYSTGDFNMLGSCCNMATQLVPNGSENGVVVGFQTSIGDNNGYADMFYNSDNFATASPYILRLNSAGLLAYGVGTAGIYTFGTPNPTALATTYFSVNTSGNVTATTFTGALSGTATNATNVAITIDNTSGTYYIPFAKTSGTGNKPLFIDDTTSPLTYNPSTSNLSATTFTGSHVGTANITNAANTTTLANPLVLNFGTLTFKNFYNNVNLTSALTVSSISFSNAVEGGNYMVVITTGVGGSFTFNTGITSVKTTFATAFTVPASSVAIMNIYYIVSTYIVGINILT